jgi:hypothetical protein
MNTASHPPVFNQDAVSPPSSPDVHRQGEWLFVPLAATDAAPLVIHWCAPLDSPSGGAPAIVAELGRGLGDILRHHPHHAVDGLSAAAFRQLPDDVRLDPGWRDQLRVIDVDCVLARGAVRHVDHPVLQLGSWHRVSRARA